MWPLLSGKSLKTPMPMPNPTQGQPRVAMKSDLTRTLSDQVLGLIKSRNLQPGDRLPSMKELAQTFSVATPTIREALRRLQATGVVDIKHGSGIYVRRTNQHLMLVNPHVGDLDGATVLDLLDARLIIEPPLAGMAAINASEEDIARLEQVLDEAEHLLKGDDLQLNPVNMRFHSVIARASGNRVLAQMLESLVELYTREQLVILEIFNARVRDYRDHILIFGAIRDREPELASRRMTRHLQTVRSVVEDRMAEQAE
jgi:GntR family transcriptional repressor for pyruvate dehydrogenase complex